MSVLDHGEWRHVVHIDSDLPEENVLGQQPGWLLPMECITNVIAATCRR